MGKFQEKVDAMAAPVTTTTSDTASGPPVESVEEVSTVTTEVQMETVREAESVVTVEKAEVQVEEEKFSGFFVDTTPAPIHARNSATERIIVDRAEESVPLGQDRDQDQEDEVIVYVAPHPKNSEVAAVAEEVARMETAKATTEAAVESTAATTTTSTPTPAPLNPLTMSFPTLSSTSTTPSHPHPHPHPHPSSSPPTTSTSITTTTTHRPLRQFISTPTPSSSTLRTPRSLLKSRHPRSSKIQRRAQERKALFGSFGAIMDERRLQGQGQREVDPRREEQRRGESDVDWGDEDLDEESDEEEEGKVEREDGGDGVREVEGGIGGMVIDDGDGEEEKDVLGGEEGGMDVDVDVGGDGDLEAMKAFVRGMGAQGERHVTMDELEDEERMRREDAEDTQRGGGRGSSDEESDEKEDEDGDEMDEEMEAVLRVEERELIAEDGAGEDGENDEDEDEDEDDEDEDSSEDDDGPPAGNFQARLERLRERSRGRPILDMLEAELDEENDDFEPGFAWEDGDDDDLVAQVQEFLDENEEILSARDRNQRNRIFKAIQNGDFDSDDAELLGLKPASMFLLHCLLLHLLLIHSFPRQNGRKIRTSPPTSETNGPATAPKKPNTNAPAPKPASKPPPTLSPTRKAERKVVKRLSSPLPSTPPSPPSPTASPTSRPSRVKSDASWLI